ncbi:MAG: hypothetical protein ACOX40_04010 [Bacilli bacterium]|jgi:hypothetical protein|nr:hypothetical protein [Acholeplasmataceae bacterium]
MNQLLGDFQEIKLRLFSDRRIIIENYKKLKDINNDMIVIDNYIIVGNFLKIRKMDPMMIEIYGEINEIIIG